MNQKMYIPQKNDRHIYEETAFVFVLFIWFLPFWRGVVFCLRNLRFHVEEEGKGMDPEAFSLAVWQCSEVFPSPKIETS